VEEIAGLASAVLPGGIITGDFEYDESTVRGEVELAATFGKLYAEITRRE
jgi:hypothetical protein